MDKLPHEFHPSLTEERISKLAHLIRDARHECLEHFDASAGDTNWSYGCRARDWVRQAFRNANEDRQTYPFLSLLEDNGQRFIFAVEGIPVKFFKDDPEEPDARVRKQSISEVMQLSLFNFGDDDEAQDIVWRFVVETNPIDLEVIKIVFVGLDQFDSTICYYDVPLEIAVSTLHSVTPYPEEGIELPVPEISKKKVIQTTIEEVGNGE